MLKEFYLRPRIIKNYALRMVENPRNAGNFLKGLSAFLKTVVQR